MELHCQNWHEACFIGSVMRKIKIEVRSMKKALKMFALMTFVSLAVFAGRKFHTPEAAALNCNEIQQLLNDGYSLDSTIPNQYRYIVEPVGVYTWGRVQVQLHKRTGGPMSLETTYATVFCEVQHDKRKQNDVYSVLNVSVETSVVY